MAATIAILEDDPGRTAAFRDVLARLAADHVVVIIDNAPDLIGWLEQGLASSVLICLDHDLGPSRHRGDERFEPGCGRDVVDWLAQRPAQCPVIVHSSNGVAVTGMLFALEEAGWSTGRVIPFGGLDWVEAEWAPAITRALRTRLGGRDE